MLCYSIDLEQGVRPLSSPTMISTKVQLGVDTVEVGVGVRGLREKQGSGLTSSRGGKRCLVRGVVCPQGGTIC